LGLVERGKELAVEKGGKEETAQGEPDRPIKRLYDGRKCSDKSEQGDGENTGVWLFGEDNSAKGRPIEKRKNLAEGGEGGMSEQTFRWLGDRGTSGSWHPALRQSSTKNGRGNVQPPLL